MNEMNRCKSFCRGFREGMTEFGHNINVIVNSLLLLIAYIFGVGITAIIAKMSGKEFLAMKKKETTYWKDLDLKKKPMDSYYRQF